MNAFNLMLEKRIRIYVLSFIFLSFIFVVTNALDTTSTKAPNSYPVSKSIWNIFNSNASKFRNSNLTSVSDRVNNFSFASLAPASFARRRFDPGRDPMWTNRLIFTSLYGVLFLLGLANVLVLFIVSRYRRMRTVTNIFIFNLCLADLVYISFLPIVIIFQLLRDWMFGVAVCKLFYIAESTAKYASVYFVSVLSLDRYLAMCHPHWCKRYRHPTLALTISCVGWIVTATLMIPIYLYSTVIGSDGSRFCTVSWPSPIDWDSSMFDRNCIDLNRSINDRNVSCNSSNFTPQTSYTPPSVQFYFVTMTFVFCFGLPALVMLYFYFQVIRQLMQASNRAERLRKKRENTYRKVTRMVLCVITCYVLCWMPYWIQFLIVTFVNIRLNDFLKILFNSIHLLPYLNCALNPILYGLMTENFRRILAELFPCFNQGHSPGHALKRTFKSIQSPVDSRRRSELEKFKNTNVYSNRRRTRSASCANAVDEHDEFEPKRLLYVRESISQSVRLVSDFSFNLLTAHSSTALSTETTL